VPRQNAAESRKILESGSVIPREGVERPESVEKESGKDANHPVDFHVIPREGVESDPPRSDDSLPRSL
jgi:hypothetical protein